MRCSPSSRAPTRGLFFYLFYLFFLISFDLKLKIKYSSYVGTCVLRLLKVLLSLLSKSVHQLSSHQLPHLRAKLFFTILLLTVRVHSVQKGMGVKKDWHKGI